MFWKIVLATLLSCGSISVVNAGPQHSMDQIDTCYHWLEKSQLQAKVNFANDNNGALYFHQKQPVYCWKSPLGAYSSWEDHGSELLRIKLKPEIRVVEQHRSASIDDMRYSPVVYSKENSWHEYLIAPGAIESWSTYQPNMVVEMKAELAYYELGLTTQNDIFYPSQYFNLNYLRNQLPGIIENHSKMAQGGRGAIYGTHPENHFKTRFKLRWQSMLQVNADETFGLRSTLPTVEIITASYGINLGGSKNMGNVTDKARAFCQGKTECVYKIHPKFIGDPAPGQDKDFEITWRCTGKATPGTPVKIAAPADNKVIPMSCL